jgi:acyl-CoA thioesterase I
MLPFVRCLYFFIALFLSGAAISPGMAHATSTIVMFGDSLVAGYRLKSEESLPVQVYNLLTGQGYDVIVINQGVSGNTTSGGRMRLQNILDTKHPDIVILALGANDMLKSVDPTVIRDNIDFMLRQLQERRIKTILMRVTPPPGYNLAYAAALVEVYSDMGKKYSVPVYPFFLEPIYGNSGYMQADGVHPNGAGVAFIAKYLSDYLISTGWISKKVP